MTILITTIARYWWVILLFAAIGYLGMECFIQKANREATTAAMAERLKLREEQCACMREENGRLQEEINRLRGGDAPWDR